MTKGRSIRLFLVDGTPRGIITAEIMNWTGHVMFAPRSRLPDLIQRTEAGRTGVYFLTGTDAEESLKPLVYVGETDNVGKRVAQHNRDETKDFWDRVCVVTSKDQNLTKSHAKYLESRLIAIATDAGRAKLINNTAPDYGLLPEADIADMEFFIEQIRIVLPVLGLEFLREIKYSPTNYFAQGLSANAEPGEAPEAEKTVKMVTLEDLRLTDASESSEMYLHRPVSRFRPSSNGQDSPAFELRDNKDGLVASACEIDGEMIVLKGSHARKAEGKLSGTYRQMRRDLISSGGLKDNPENPQLLIFSSDTPFSSPSSASNVVFGRSDNGRKSWRIKGTKKTYADWQEEQISSVMPRDPEA